MTEQVVRLVYPHAEIPLILRSSFEDNAYYGIDIFERKKMKIILAKYGCRHNFHTLPGKVTVSLHPFTWDRFKQCYRIQMDRMVDIHLNTLEEMIVNHLSYDEGYS